MTTTTTVESVLESFPNPRVPPIVGRPTQQSIQALTQLLYENAASVYSALGGGAHGHLGVIMNAVQYNTLVGANYIAPLNPGGTPVIPAGSTGPQIQRIQAQFRNETELYKLHTNVDGAMKQQIITAVPRMYIKALADPVLGFTNVTARQLLAHLKRTYGKLTHLQLEQNDKAFRADYNTNDPIENFYEQIEITTEAANDAGAAYTAPQIINNAITILTKTGCFTDAIRAWKRNCLLYTSDAADE